MRNIGVGGQEFHFYCENSRNKKMHMSKIVTAGKQRPFHHDARENKIMIRLEDLQLFVRSAALGSFSNAARESGLLPGQVSAAIQRLERTLDKRLFARSTRSLRLTSEGEKYLPYAQEMLEVMHAGEEILSGENEDFRGELKITVPSDIGRNLLLPMITEFCEQYPQMTLQLFLSDQVSDVFRASVDIAIRYGVQEQGSYVALPLADKNRRFLAASKTYLDRHGRPETLDDLSRHHCILFSINDHAHDYWHFIENGKPRGVRIRSRLLCDDADVARRWALIHKGIVYKSWFDLYPDVSAGNLEIVLPEVRGEAAPLNFICPHRRQLSPVVRSLYRHLQRQLGDIAREPDIKRR